MKKAVLEKQIAKLAKDAGVAWVLVGGSKHDKFTLNGVVITVPRHSEIGEMLAKKILKDCDKALDRQPKQDGQNGTDQE